jgi:mRNA-degrading endonuclease RelE of RelBE toxin-antitoxin system
MFEIYLDIPAQKFLKKTDRITAERIMESIEKLAEDPIPHDSKRVIGMNEKVFRIRAGKYRVLYRVDYKKYIVVIIKIDLRKHVYLN